METCASCPMSNFGSSPLPMPSMLAKARKIKVKVDGNRNTCARERESARSRGGRAGLRVHGLTWSGRFRGGGGCLPHTCPLAPPPGGGGGGGHPGPAMGAGWAGPMAGMMWWGVPRPGPRAPPPGGGGGGGTHLRLGEGLEVGADGRLDVGGAAALLHLLEGRDAEAPELFHRQGVGALHSNHRHTNQQPQDALKTVNSPG